MVETLLDSEVIERSIVGYEDTIGAAEQSINLSLDGSVPAVTIAVGVDVLLLINDFIVCGEDAVESRFRLQQSNDGGGSFFDIALARVGQNDTNPQTYETPLRVVGGAGVLLQVRAETISGIARVGVTVRSAQMTVNGQ